MKKFLMVLTVLISGACTSNNIIFDEFQGAYGICLNMREEKRIKENKMILKIADNVGLWINKDFPLSYEDVHMVLTCAIERDLLHETNKSFENQSKLFECIQKLVGE